MVEKKGMAKKNRKNAVAKRNIKPGDTYECKKCGLTVTVDEICGCAEAHELICCGEPMKKKGTKTKAVTQGKIKVGDKFVCRECGYSVTVDEICGCAEVHELICHGRMIKKRAKK